MRNILRALCALSIVALFSVPCTAQDFARKSLRGLDAVSVLVEDLDSQIERDGLSASQIKTDVELRLRRNGIKVDDNSRNYLDVFVKVLKAQPPGPRGYAYSIDVTVIQPALLERDKSPVPLATTWQAGVLGTLSPESLRDIRGFVLDYVDKFINDYLAVNPKQ